MTKQLTEEQLVRLAKNEYAKEYRKKNKKKISEYNRRYRENHPERVKEYNKKYWLKQAEELQKKAK